MSQCFVGEVPGENRKRPNEEHCDAPESKKQKLTQKKSLCPICLDQMNDLELIATPCAHLYHVQCLLTSYEYTNRCPVCRTPMEELAGYQYSGPRRVSTHNDGDDDDEEEEFVPTQRCSTSRRTRNRGQRTNRRSRRAPTPYPNENEAEQQPVQGTSTEVESTPSASCQQAENIQPEDTENQVEYTPVTSSNDEDNATEEDDANDPDDPDYVPEAEQSSTDSLAEDSYPDSQAEGSHPDSPAEEPSPDPPDADSITEGQAGLLDWLTPFIAEEALNDLPAEDSSEASSNTYLYALNESRDAPETEESSPASIEAGEGLEDPEEEGNDL